MISGSLSMPEMPGAAFRLDAGKPRRQSLGHGGSSGLTWARCLVPAAVIFFRPLYLNPSPTRARLHHERRTDFGLPAASAYNSTTKGAGIRRGGVVRDARRQRHHARAGSLAAATCLAHCRFGNATSQHAAPMDAQLAGRPLSGIMAGWCLAASLFAIHPFLCFFSSSRHPV